MFKLDKNYRWQGREDVEDGELGFRWHQVINQEPDKSGIALLGFACDLGVKINKGRAGADAGPNKIRDALANMAWHSSYPLTDIGNVLAADNLAEAQYAYAQNIAISLQRNSLVIGLGGGHEIAWGSYQGLCKHLKSDEEKNIGIINFDAHFDLRKPAPSASSGTPFRQISELCQQLNKPFNYACLGVTETANTIALFNYARDSNTRYLLDRECKVNAAKKLLIPFLQDIDELYLTICLDAFPAYLAPGVSAPSPLGISPTFVIDMIHWLASSQSEYGYNWQLADIAEMNPAYDIDNRTAKLAARLIFEIVKAKFQKF